jgi:uncharacterized membrane protein YhaH (DUF805 family)
MLRNNRGSCFFLAAHATGTDARDDRDQQAAYDANDHNDDRFVLATLRFARVSLSVAVVHFLADFVGTAAVLARRLEMIRTPTHVVTVYVRPTRIHEDTQALAVVHTGLLLVGALVSRNGAVKYRCLLLSVYR